MSVPERYWTWTATGEDGEPQPVVSAFAGSEPALDALDVERRAGALARLARATCATTSSSTGDGAVLSTWADDPWVARRLLDLAAARGGRRGRAPHRPARIRRRAHGAASHAALMEGAIRSGRRAARSLLRRVTSR